MQLKLKISIAKEPGIPFMGPGPLRLLEKIREHKSINQAARSMNLSYVKALNMLNRMERSLNRRILIRTRGGNERGGTRLTPYAEKYIERYIRLEEKISSFARSEFDQFQNEFQKEKENENA